MSEERHHRGRFLTKKKQTLLSPLDAGDPWEDRLETSTWWTSGMVNFNSDLVSVLRVIFTTRSYRSRGSAALTAVRTRVWFCPVNLQGTPYLVLISSGTQAHLKQ